MTMQLPTRRAFLSAASVAAVGLSVQKWAIAGPNVGPQTIALISDTHIHTDPTNEYRGFRPSENLKTTVEQILKREFACTLLCGDAARANGQKTDYERLKEFVTPLQNKMPMHIALGNHDDRDNFWSVFHANTDAKPLAGKKHVSVIDFGSQRWVVLDSLMYVDKVPGFLGEEQRDWLDKLLSENPAMPTILMVHHTLGPHDGELLDAERLIAIAHKHSNVHGIIFGHSHQWSITEIDGLWHINLPAVGYNFADTQPVGWVSAELTDRSLQLDLQAIAGNKTPELMSKKITW